MATTKPRSHHKRPVVEREAPKDVPPTTEEEVAAQMQQLIESARIAGLNPLRALVRTYADIGKAVVTGLLTSLENADSSKKKKA